MRKIGLIIVVSLLSASNLFANVVYTLSFTIPERIDRTPWDVSLSVTTDGTLGVLTKDNFISWTVDLDGNGYTATGTSTRLDSPDNYLELNSALPVATATELLLPSGGYLRFIAGTQPLTVQAPTRVEFENYGSDWEITAVGIQPPAYKPLGNSMATRVSGRSGADLPVTTTSTGEWVVGSTIPEPSSIGLIGLMGGCAWFVRRFFA
jgi:hypothetical protein